MTATAATDAPGHFLVVFREQARVDGDERRGEHALAEEVLQEVRDLEGGLECAGGGGVAKVVREDALADEARDAAQQDARGDEHRKARTRATRIHLRHGALRYLH